MKKNIHSLSFWGIFVIVAAIHVSVLGVVIEQNTPPSSPAVKKINVSLSRQVLPVETKKENKVSKKQTPKKRSAPKKKLPTPPKKPAAQKKQKTPKKAPQKKLLQQAQVLSAAPEKVKIAEEKESIIAAVATTSDNMGTEDNPKTDTATADRVQSNYIAYIQNYLLQTKYYPLTARKRHFEGEVKLTFSIMPDGTIKNIRLSSPSKYTVLNNATLDAIKSIDSFRPLPKELHMNSLEVTVPFIYKLK